MTLFHFGLSQLQLYFMPAVYFFKSGCLLGTKLDIYRVYLFIPLGQPRLQPAHLLSLFLVFRSNYLGYILTVLHLSASPPFYQFDDTLYASDTAY